MIAQPRHRLARLAFRPHLPRRTVRLRLTGLYGGLFLLSGAALLAITYLLVVNNTSGFIFSNQSGTIAFNRVHDHLAHKKGPESKGPGSESPEASSRAGQAHTPSHAKPNELEAQATRQHSTELHQLLIQSGIALAGMSLISIVLGWIIAGRVLGPLRTITATAREISASNLHERLALDGPDDELKELGDTFDALLSRLEASFDAQRRFVANASHELRTPLALGRAMLQVALADPDLTLDSLRAACEDVLDAGTEQEQLIDALLTLARSQQGLDRSESFDLAQLVDEVIQTQHQHAATRAVRIEDALSRATVSGDRRLAKRLAINLIENALCYNAPGGRVEVLVYTSAAHATLTVANTGPQIAADQIDRLLQPFQRLAADRTAQTPGVGLGLSIVQAIADAHGATVAVHPQTDGGLRVTVSFPNPGPRAANRAVSDRPPSARARASRYASHARGLPAARHDYPPRSAGSALSTWEA
jgi:signal transduction histidine kinase